MIFFAFLAPFGSLWASLFGNVPDLFCNLCKISQKTAPSYSVSKDTVFFFAICHAREDQKSLKIIENRCFFYDFADFTYFTFSARWHQFWAISHWFWMDLPLKMTVKGRICFPLASLESILPDPQFLMQRLVLVTFSVTSDPQTPSKTDFSIILTQMHQNSNKISASSR